MSGFPSQPPTLISSTYNPYFYGLGNSVDTSLISGIIPGTASASKALILDSSFNVIGLNKLSSSNLEVRSNSSTILSTVSTTSAYGLQLVTELASTNGSLKGCSIGFLHGTSDLVPFGAIVCQKMSTTTADIVFSNRINGTSVSETFRIASNGACKAGKALLVGTSSDDTRAISCLNSALAVGSSNYICFGKSATSKNQCELSYYHSGDDNVNNRFELGMYGVGPIVYITAGGYVGIGVSTPSCPLDVSTSVSVQIASTGTVYQCLLTTGFSSQAAPFSASLSARFRSNVWIQNTIYCSSDKRLKQDINDLDFELDHYIKLKPMSYRMKNDDSRIHLGLIAQDVLSVCSEAVTVTPNGDMHIEEEGDLEGAQYNVDYNCINMMNVVAIKKLIDLSKIQESRIKNLEDQLRKLYGAL